MTKQAICPVCGERNEIVGMVDIYTDLIKCRCLKCLPFPINFNLSGFLRGPIYSKLERNCIVFDSGKGAGWNKEAWISNGGKNKKEADSLEPHHE
jgi:hypothetical protein